MSIISNRPTMSFKMTDSVVNLNAKFEHPYLKITPEGVVSSTAALKALPNGSVDLVIPETINDIKVVSISINGFYNCLSLKSVILPNSVCDFGSAAFSSCYELTSINIPSSVTIITDSVFYGCTSLTSINIPEGVTIIGKNAFHSCLALTSINIPNSVESIDLNALTQCNSLISINIPTKTPGSIGGAPWGAPNAKVFWFSGSGGGSGGGSSSGGDGPTPEVPKPPEA